MDPPPSTTLPPDHTDEDRCKLLGTTGLVVQALMGIFVILSLVVKRQLEKRKRSWRIWIYDVGKQLAGQAVVHGLNVLISDVVASAAHNNPCSLYFLNVLIDTTIGVAIIYFSLKAFTWYFSSYMGMEGFVSGQYGHPPSPVFWWKQLAPYLMSIITMKLLVLLPLTLPGISKTLIDWSHNLLDHFGPKGQVIFAMAIFPVVMNVLQFCLVDQVIKAGGEKDEEEEDHQGGGGGYRRVRDWEDHNGLDHNHGDLESGQSQLHRPQSREVCNNKTGRKESSTSTITTKNPVVIPSSPLLSSTTRDYGSTSPSPIGSPVRQTASLSDPNSLWSKLINKVSDVSSSTRSNSTVFFDAQTDLEDEQQSNSTSTSVDTRRNDRLYVRDERGKRSAAPSPETLPIQSPSLSIPSEFDHHEQDGNFEEVVGGEGSRTPSPPSTIAKTSTTYSHRHLPEELEREARWTLSPPESPTIDNLRNSVDSVSLREVSRSQFSDQ